ncbi:MAG: hypoxanthine phosphoribosyltransferase [Bryobacteraceae bacterium]|nr:hypoxanthine phosphoribosyltransferase [Bryobacterales bacterium]MEB2360949.1 hypoxanthine phosphoribosyltransferase [Bryobacterales bacterium]NUN03192.1 hypoxanthine phosphoribosyltransferase [Bryobacteraceae bacterium]
MSDLKLRVLIPASEIQQRIEELARKISADYSGRSVLLIGILKGACFFLADLARALTIPARIDFAGISSYGQGTVSSNQVKLTKDIELCIEGMDVLIVEDIVDSGVTLTYLCDLLAKRRPKSIRIAALLEKPERRRQPVEIHYLGFQIPNEFVVGFGLDYAEDYRNLRDICVLEQ